MFEAGAFLPRHNSMVRNLQKQVCEGFHLRASFCRNALLQIVGSGTDNLDLVRYNIIYWSNLNLIG